MSETTSEKIEDQPKITSNIKTKYPRRVEAGRRLGLMSKEAKERKKMTRKMEMENADNKEDSYASLFILGAIPLAIGAYYVYNRVSHKDPPVEDPPKKK